MPHNFYRNQLTVYINDEVYFVAPLYSEVIKIRLLFSCIISGFQSFQNDKVFKESAEKRITC